MSGEEGRRGKAAVVRHTRVTLFAPDANLAALKSLGERGGIPRPRLSCWVDPDLQHGAARGVAQWGVRAERRRRRGHLRGSALYSLSVVILLRGASGRCGDRGVRGRGRQPGLGDVRGHRADGKTRKGGWCMNTGWFGETRLRSSPKLCLEMGLEVETAVTVRAGQLLLFLKRGQLTGPASRHEPAPPPRRSVDGSNGCSTQATAYLRATPPPRRGNSATSGKTIRDFPLCFIAAARSAVSQCWK